MYCLSELKSGGAFYIIENQIMYLTSIYHDNLNKYLVKTYLLRFDNARSQGLTKTHRDNFSGSNQ